MGLFKTFLALTAIASSTLLVANDHEEELKNLRQRTHYFCKTQKTEKAVEAYLDYLTKTGLHDEEALRSLSLSILEESMSGENQELQLLSLFCLSKLGEKIAQPYLEKLILSPFPECQLSAIASPFLSSDQIYEKHLLRLMGSPYLGIRLQALYQLAQKKHPSTVGLAASLEQKIPEQYHMLLPLIYAEINDSTARHELKKLLNHSFEHVRTETMAQIGNHNIRDFTPQLQRILNRPSTTDQEMALMILTDWSALSSLPVVEQLCDSKNINLRCTALYAIHKEKENFATEKMAETLKSNQPVPLRWGRFYPKLENELVSFLNHPDQTLSLNATLSLLDLKSTKALAKAVSFVLGIYKDNFFWPSQSPGGACTYWKVVHGPQPPMIPAPELHRATLYLAETMLGHIATLDDIAFFNCCDQIIRADISPLFPRMIALLAESSSDIAITTLKKCSQKLGTPSLRILAVLALYTKEPSAEGLHAIIAWIEAQPTSQLFKIRNIPDPNQMEVLKAHKLSLEQTSELVLQAYQTLADSQDPEALTAMVKWLRTANTRHRCILATAILSTLI